MSNILIHTITKVNISTILLSRLFDNEYHESYKASYQNITDNLYYPLLYLAYEYGLLNCYLDKTESYVIFVFKKQERSLEDKNLTKSAYYNVIDRLIDNHNFYDIINFNDKIIKVRLKIPETYMNDVKFIVNTSKYSQTSEVFKHKMRISYSEVPTINNHLARFIITNNLASGIVNKFNSLKEQLEYELNVTKLGDEFFKQFSNKEYWDDELLYSLN